MFKVLLTANLFLLLTSSASAFFEEVILCENSDSDGMSFVISADNADPRPPESGIIVGVLEGTSMVPENVKFKYDFKNLKMTVAFQENSFFQKESFPTQGIVLSLVDPSNKVKLNDQTLTCRFTR